MVKPKSGYSCRNCGHFSSKWQGKCPACDEWNALEESVSVPENATGSLADLRTEMSDLRSDMAGMNGLFPAESTSGVNWVSLLHGLHGPHGPNAGDQNSPASKPRMSTGISELDRVLGGGLVSDSFTLLGGDPGIGKSTLLLQMAQGLGLKQPGVKVFYVSGEESIDQIRSRSLRLGVTEKAQIFLGAETQLEKVIQAVKEIKPEVLIIDSLQTFSTGFIHSAQGSVAQVREVAARLMTLAKSAGIAVWLVGHVTKEGSIAGPKTVEHMVDTVLYFEGEGGQNYRLLRTVKNRFGSTRELGVFEMEGEGLKEVTNPSSLFLSQRTEPVSGTAVSAPLEGLRPLMVEVQALVTSSGLAMPRRTSVGMDSVRVSLLAAILEKHSKLSLASQDLFFNVAGGLKLSEPACDLAAAAAIWSSAKDKAVPLGWVFLGELGLTGEVRPIPQMELRLQEASRLGFHTSVVPKSTSPSVLEKLKANTGLKLIYISRIYELNSILS